MHYALASEQATSATARTFFLPYAVEPPPCGVDEGKRDCCHCIRWSLFKGKLDFHVEEKK